MPRQKTEKLIKSFGKGTVNIVEAELIDDEAASSSTNFVTELDKVFLTYGRKLVGNETAGSSPVLGLKSISLLTGTDVLFRKIAGNLQYYDSVSNTWSNINTLTLNMSDVTIATDIIAHSGQIDIQTGQTVNFTNTGGGLPAPLVASTTYYAIRVSANTIKVATSLINATAGTAIDITTTGTGTNYINVFSSFDSTSTLDFDVFYSPAGRQLWACGLDGLFKIYPTSPTYLLPMYNKTKNFKGHLRIEKSRMAVWNTPEDATGLKLSKIDKDANYKQPNATFTGTTDIATDIITYVSSAEIKSGDKVVFTTSGTIPTGITAGTTYYAIRNASNKIKLATTTALALAGTSFAISGGAGTINITVTADYIGASGSTNYTGYLRKGQIFGVLFTDGSRNLYDDKSEKVNTDGTGTVNYATGQYDITFSTATTGYVYATYLYEDPTSGGIADFTYTSPTRLSAEGAYLRQDSTGTKSYNVLTFNNKFYTLQDRGSFQLTIDATDTTFNNEVFNTVIAGASFKSSIASSDGIIFVDVSDPAKPRLRKLSYDQLGDKVVPYDLSNNFDMSKYLFDKSCMVRFGNYVIFSCRDKNHTANNTTIMYHLLNKSFDVLNNGYDFFEIANNKLYGGDALSPNVYEILSGFDDLDFTIEGEWIGKNDTLDTEQLKKVKRFYIEGYIAPSQSFDIFVSYDRADWTLIHTIVGTDSYVDTGLGQSVGSAMYAENMYGGEGDGVTAYFYKHVIKLQTPKFERLRLKFVPKGTGYLSITQRKWSDIRPKGFKALRKYK